VTHSGSHSGQAGGKASLTGCWRSNWRKKLPFSLIVSLVGLLTVPTLVAQQPDPAAKAQPAKPRDDLPGLENFAEVSAALCRGAQPTAEGFATLKARGVKTVVNLRVEYSDRSMLAGTGLQYAEIPCNPFHLEDKEAVRFLKIVGDPKNQPVFVHCAYGSDRTGTMVAAYRMTKQNWSADEAIKELRVFGYHPYYPQILSFLKALNPATIDAKVDAAPAPKLEVVK
jgi:tyrosine-protein phosphatase SIW14